MDSKNAIRNIGQNLTIISKGSNLNIDDEISINEKGKMKYKEIAFANSK